MKTIAIIGRPNVGKSSLFNILTKSRDALVSDFPGLTRDRHYSKIKINNSLMLIVDTGGLEASRTENIINKMYQQTELAIDESDLIFFIVDGRLGRHPQDDEIARFLRKKNKTNLLIINKCEGLNQDLLKFEFKKLGIENQICISASHNEGIDLIYDFLAPYCDDRTQEEANDKKIKLSILGKPNVGKSTLINSIVGEDRFIAFDQPGTTRDSVSTDFEYKEKKFLIIDTAGIRKKGRVSDTIEKFSVLKSILAINESDVSVLVINADEGLGSQDLQILGYILESGKPLVVAVNKWDLLDSYQKEVFRNSITKKNHFFSNYEVIYISAINKIGINDLWEAILRAYSSSICKIKTSILNKFINDLQQSHQPPIFRGIRPKLKYAHQGDTCPPTIIIHGNHLSGIKKDYIRFIESSIIKAFKLIGTPIRIQLNESKNPYDIDKVKIKKTGLVTRRKEINKKREYLKKKKLKN